MPDIASPCAQDKFALLFYAGHKLRIQSDLSRLCKNYSVTYTNETRQKKKHMREICFGRDSCLLLVSADVQGD
jgi:hypothetical protein